MPSQKSPTPAPLSRLAQRFAAWRKTRAAGERIPDRLWQAAIKMAATYGIHPTARALNLDYYSVKKRLAGADTPPATTFVELPSSPLVSSECVIEWEDAAGARMRVHVKGQTLPDVLALSRSFWSAD